MSGKNSQELNIFSPSALKQLFSKLCFGANRGRGAKKCHGKYCINMFLSRICTSGLGLRFLELS